MNKKRYLCCPSVSLEKLKRRHEKERRFIHLVKLELVTKAKCKTFREALEKLLKVCESFLVEIKGLSEVEEYEKRYCAYASLGVDLLESASAFAFLKEDGELIPEEEVLFDKWIKKWETYRTEKKFYERLPFVLSSFRESFKFRYGFLPPKSHWWFWEPEDYKTPLRKRIWLLIKDYESIILEIPIVEEMICFLPSIREKIWIEDAFRKEVMELDKAVIEEVLPEISDFPPGEEKKPLHKWWWHLRKIKEGAYPAELLPDYLGEVYEKWLKTKFGK